MCCASVICDARPRIHCFDPNENPRQSTVHMSEYEDRLLFAIRSGQEKPIKEAVQSWIDHVQKMKYINMEQLELWGHEFDVIKARWLKELFGDLPIALSFPSESAFLHRTFGPGWLFVASAMG